MIYNPFPLLYLRQEKNTWKLSNWALQVLKVWLSTENINHVTFSFQKRVRFNAS